MLRTASRRAFSLERETLAAAAAASGAVPLLGVVFCVSTILLIRINP